MWRAARLARSCWCSLCSAAGSARARWLGGAEKTRTRHGFAALWQGGGGWAGLLLIYFIAPRARKFAGMTIPDLLESRYNQGARVLGVIAVLFTYTAITSYQLIGGGDILHLIFPRVTAVDGQFILAAFVVLFTAIAGMGSVAYMDVVIGLLATFTMIAALPVLIHLAGGWHAVHLKLPSTHFQVLGDLSGIQALELFLPTCLLMLGNQSMYQKFFSAKSEQDATRAVSGWIVGTVILETVIVAIAVVGSALFPAGEVHDRPREILAYTAVHAFGGGRLLSVLGALLVGAIFAKVVSTANNYLFSPATNLINDVFVRYIRPEASNCRCGVDQPFGCCGSGGLVAVAVAGNDQRTENEPVRLHDLLSRADAGDPGSVLLAACHGRGRGVEHRRGYGGDRTLGKTVLQPTPAPAAGGARRDPAGAVGEPALPGRGEPADTPTQ